jgi:hypothetical protein
MFARKALPVGTLFMVLIIAVAALGVGYGLWNEFLYIEGTVNTGEVDAELAVESITEDDHGKEVGDCTTVLSDKDGDGDNEWLDVAITNGYPSYSCTVQISVINNGTIPIHIYQPSITNPNPTELTVSLGTCYADDTQIHPAGDPEPDHDLCEFIVHVEQEADENSTYTFSAEIEARQFNETRCPNDCSGNGTCDESTQYLCVCDASWTGSDCSIAE